MLLDLGRRAEKAAAKSACEVTDFREKDLHFMPTSGVTRRVFTYSTQLSFVEVNVSGESGKSRQVQR
jgi:hypothetical protein